MARLVWDAVGERTFEAGVDRAVLYPDGGVGVVWNGITAVDESSTITASPVFFNGRKINDVVTLGHFSGVLRAFTYPDEFLVCEGLIEDEVGVFIADQPVKRFNLCYRTGIGNDLVAPGSDYKLHLIYNLTAIPATKTRATLGLEVSPQEFEWELTSIPEDIPGYRPSSHIVIDSRQVDPFMLRDLEDILYGDEVNEPQLPTLSSLMAFIQKWNRFIIVDNGDGTWTATSRDDSEETITVDGPSQLFTIVADSAVFIDANSYDISSSTKNVEDI